MKNNFLRLFIFLIGTLVFAQADKVAVINNADGMKLVVNGEDL